MKLRKLHIEQYKMFKDFDMSFVDKNDEPFPIIVLAGVNGSGKTTLLEYLNDCFRSQSLVYKNDFIEIISEKEFKGLISIDYVPDFEITQIRGKNFQDYSDKYRQNIVYLPVYDNNIVDLKESIFEYYRGLIRENLHIEVLKKIQEFIGIVFDGLDINLTIADIDNRDTKNQIVTFKNSNGDSFEIEELSTGEKTLFSKIFYLYFKSYINKVILIDEPELSLHPKWQNKVLKIYENFAELNDCQIIIATHSPHIIGSANNEYLRFLTEDGVINDIEAYGRDINWILEQMGVENLRVSKVLEKFTKCQQLLNDEEYDEAEDCINSLEEDIGKDDRQVMNLRNSLFFERD